jgi:hypothetical protein
VTGRRRAPRVYLRTRLGCLGCTAPVSLAVLAGLAVILAVAVAVGR